MGKGNGCFLTPAGRSVEADEMVEEIAGFVHSEPDEFYRLVIGTDSQTRQINGYAEINYVTAVIIHRQGTGAKYYWKNQKEKVKIPVLRQKIYTETTLSLDAAQVLVPTIRKLVSSAKYDLEIHIDVGPLGPTREMIKEVVGMVNGNGYIAKTKPDSWGASSVADKHT